MAENTQAQPLADTPLTTTAIMAPIVGWIIPGGGHFMQQKWIRGALLSISIIAMFSLGLGMEGKIYSPNTGDILDMLGFVGDIGAGGLYILARMLDWGRGAIHLATADYGTKFIIVSGLLNVISAVDAYHIAIGKKQ
ncbi:MAG: hypothetical protein JWO13_2842 [Acidobacteriales bacterium]|nr:hypothetical protein [Terriglobales bacterium]